MHRTLAKDTRERSCQHPVLTTWGTIEKTYGSPNKRRIRNRVDNGEGRSFLFFRLTASCADPSKDDGIDRICTNGENAHGEVAGTGVQRRTAEHETKDSDSFGAGDVPRPFVVLAGTPGPVNRQNAGDEVWRACEYAALSVSHRGELQDEECVLTV